MRRASHAGSRLSAWARASDHADPADDGISAIADVHGARDEDEQERELIATPHILAFDEPDEEALERQRAGRARLGGFGFARVLSAPTDGE